MFRFRPANPNRLLIRGIVAMIFGVASMVVPDLSLKMIMQFLGALLLAEGIVAFSMSYFSKNEKKAYLLVPRGTSNLVFGIILLAFPALLINVFIFVIGLLLVLAGASQLSNQFSANGKLRFSWPMALISAISFVAGIVLIARPFESAQTVLILFGAVVFVYGLGEIIWSFKIRRLRQQQATENPTVIDTPYEEVE